MVAAAFAFAAKYRLRLALKGDRFQPDMHRKAYRQPEASSMLAAIRERVIDALRVQVMLPASNEK